MKNQHPNSEVAASRGGKMGRGLVAVNQPGALRSAQGAYSIM